MFISIQLQIVLILASFVVFRESISGVLGYLKVELKRETDEDTIKDGEFLYYAEIGIGNPLVKHKFIIDTRSSDTWIPYKISQDINPRGFVCVKDSQESTCKKLSKSKYEIKSSMQTKNLVVSKYQDRFNLSCTKFFSPNESISGSLIFQHDIFGARTCLNSEKGVLGMAPLHQSSLGNSSLFNSINEASIAIDNKPDSKDFRSPVICLKLGPFAGVMYIGNSSQVFSNDYDCFQAATHKGDWEIPINNVKFDNISLSTPPSDVIFDTGTNQVQAPPQAINQMINSLDAEYDDKLMKYIFDCAKLGKFPLIFNFRASNYTEHAWKIDTEYYSQRVQIGKKSYCFLNIEISNYANAWIFGTDIMQSSRIIAFDYGTKKVCLQK